MKKEIYICDACKKETREYLGTEGYIICSSHAPMTLTVQLERHDEGYPRSDNIFLKDDAFFCDVNCLVAFIKDPLLQCKD